MSPALITSLYTELEDLGAPETILLLQVLESEIAHTKPPKAPLSIAEELQYELWKQFQTNFELGGFNNLNLKGVIEFRALPKSIQLLVIQDLLNIAEKNVDEFPSQPNYGFYGIGVPLPYIYALTAPNYTP